MNRSTLGQRPSANGSEPPLPSASGFGTARLLLASWLQVLTEWLLPPSRERDAEMQRRGRLLVAASIAFFLVCLSFGVLMTAMGRYPASSLIVMFSGCVFTLSNLLLLKATRSTALPGFLTCLEAMAIIAFQAYNDGGLDDPTLLWLLLIPWLAAFLIRPGFGFGFAGLTCAIMGGFYLLEMRGYPFPEYSGTEEQWLFYVLSASSLAVCIGTLGWIYEGLTLKNLRASNEQLRAAHAALQASNRRIASILESISDGFFALDHEGRFTYVNSRAEKLLNEDRAALLGQRAEDLFSGQVSTSTLEKFRIAQQKGTTVELETFYAPLERWFGVHVYPFPEGLSVYFRDVTDRKAYEERLIEAREKAEELSRMKSSFLANMSHEIRTPLTGILGFANVLTEEVEDAHREFATLIEQSARRLLDTLNSVLDLAQLEGGSVTLHTEALDVADEAEEVVRLLTPLACKRGLYLRVERTTPEATATVDRTYLHRVLTNLVGNAIKFTEEGGITVEVDASGEHVQVCVTDTGIGISEEFLPHLFEEFRQESTGLGRSYEGSGLGLAITRHLVEAMDGSIEVESEKGVGTTFSISFPRRVPMLARNGHSAG